MAIGMKQILPGPTLLCRDEDVNNDNDYGWVIAEDNIDDWNDRNIFSERPMVVATIKKHSAFQLDSSADIYIHDVRKVDIEWPQSTSLKKLQKESSNSVHNNLKPWKVSIENPSHKTFIFNNSSLSANHIT